MTEEDLSIDAKLGITAAKMDDLRKKINAGTWNLNMEQLIQSWGEKAAGLRFMHQVSGGSWKNFSNKLTLSSIGITTLSAIASLVAASVQDEEAKNIVLYIVGGIGIVSSTIQNIKKFYNSEEKSADHNAIARQFGSLYRYITLQLTLSPEDRLASDKLSEYTLKEYERLQQEAPSIGGSTIKLFKDTFKNSTQAIPDICEDEFNIRIYKPPILESNIELNSVEKII